MYTSDTQPGNTGMCGLLLIILIFIIESSAKLISATMLLI